MTTTNLNALTTEQLELELKKRKAVLTKEKKKQMKQVQLDKDFLKWVNGGESEEAVEKRVEGWLEMIEAFCKAKKIPDNILGLGYEGPEWYGGIITDANNLSSEPEPCEAKSVNELKERFDYSCSGEVFQLLKEEFKKINKNK